MQITPTILKLHKTPILLVLTSTLFYWVFAYNLVRTDYVKLLTLYGALFFLFYKTVGILKHHPKVLTYIAFGFRVIFLLAIPNLSQDFYRFIWDGRLTLEGLNPYLYNVNSIINNSEVIIAQAQELQQGMGELNASHFSNYPPLNQLCFVITALLSGNSILGSAVVMRLLIIAADFGTLYFGKKLLEKLKLPIYNIFWYILNPFIIIELTGNLHFDGVMVFFLVWSLYLLHNGKWALSAVIFALSISTKLIPLMFLPLFYQWFISTKLNNPKKRLVIAIPINRDKQSVDIGEIASSQVPRNDIWKLTSRLFMFYCIIGVTTLLLFTPFYTSQFFENYTKTVALWFNNFEFNGSLYYLVREIGYLFSGKNEIILIGAFIPKLVVVFVLIISFFRNNKSTTQLIHAMLLVLSFYYFTATTVHPWYLATLLLLSIFTTYKYPLVWSGVIILSYLSYLNINTSDKSENLWIIALEYLIVYGVFIWEVFIKKASLKEA